MRRAPAVFSCCALLIAAAASPELPQEEAREFRWPSFRGPGASGIAEGQNPPMHWDPATGQNVLWRVPIPGLGHSSPIVWNDRIFLTTAISDDPDSVFRYGMDNRQDRRSDRSRQAWRVYALDRRSGEVVWMREPSSGPPTVQRHPKNSYASATPATDGERVIVLLATGDLYCFDFEGETLWHVELGPLDAGASYDHAYQWGAASSPIIWEDLVIVQADQQEGSFLAAFDLATGREVWRTQRQVISSFSTPTIHRGRNRIELVTNGAGTMHGYDPRSGEELWRISSNPADEPPTPGDPWTWATVSTPVSAPGMIFVTSVHHRARPLFAIREGATGDISLASKESSSAYVAWSSRRDGPYVTTSLVYRGYLYVVSSNGVLTVFEAETGRLIYRRRIGDVGGAYSASPVAADGRLYLTSEDGDIFVVRAGPEYELLATNRMDEVCLATPAVSGGQIFVRTTGHLFALEDEISPVVAAPARPTTTPFPSSLPATQVLPLDDFEDGDLYAGNGVRWQAFTDGESIARLELVGDGRGGSEAAARLSGTLVPDAAQGSLAQMYVAFDRGEVPRDLGRLGGVRLAARGSGPIELSFRCAGSEFGRVFDASETWRRIEIGSDELVRLSGPSPDTEWSGAECVGLYLSRRPAGDDGEFWLEVDDITLYGTEAWTTRDRR